LKESFRPILSPKYPIVKRSTELTRMYESIIHCNWLDVEPKSLEMEGRAKFKTVLSSEIIRIETQIKARENPPFIVGLGT